MQSCSSLCYALDMCLHEMFCTVVFLKLDAVVACMGNRLRCRHFISRRLVIRILLAASVSLHIFFSLQVLNLPVNKVDSVGYEPNIMIVRAGVPRLEV